MRISSTLLKIFQSVFFTFHSILTEKLERGSNQFFQVSPKTRAYNVCKIQSTKAARESKKKSWPPTIIFFFLEWRICSIISEKNIYTTTKRPDLFVTLNLEEFYPSIIGLPRIFRSSISIKKLIFINE